ncbi:MAG: SDR family NAD(P)-dependent oxidoreductase [Pseudobdellovibrionaceae bacterium]
MSENKPLDGLVALITGASRGIGAAIAKLYAANGAHVILVARTSAALEEVDDAIRALGGQATLLPLDITKFEELERLGPTIAERFGRLDIFVANAGTLGTLSPLSHGKLKSFQEVMDINVTANYQIIRSIDPLLKHSPSGRAIFVSSGVTQDKGRAYWGPYKISKAALEAMAYSYAAENESTNLRVNIVDPGRVRTKMRAAAYPGEEPETLPAPEDIVGVFLDLALPSCTTHAQIVKAQTDKRQAA